jgi:hypothetical protein
MQITKAAEKGISTAEVATRAGVHKDTILRWLKRGLIDEPNRDRHGWRSFSEEEVQKVVSYASNPDNLNAYLAREASENNRREFDVLKAIDWDFAGAKTNYLTHGIHPYPAKFIPQIPNALIQELSSVGDTVGDIFCGSGTTLVEALTLKRHAVGIDANPLACLIARSKTCTIDEFDRTQLIELAKKCSILGNSIVDYGKDSLFGTDTFHSSGWRPDDTSHDFWFDLHVTEELAEALSYCYELTSTAARELALTAFSSIVVTVSRQDSDTRYVRRKKNIQIGDTLRRFARTLDLATHAALEFSELVENRFRCEILSKDLLCKPTVPRMDLMVCSPPYPNAYSYHLYHRTRMLWLKMDQPRFKKEEIGSHRKYSSTSKTGATIETFTKEFTTIMKWLAKNLKTGGYACFVVGNSTLKGQTVNNAEIISHAGRMSGFQEVERIDRTMQSTKKSFNPHHGNIKTEQILILENSGAYL